MTLNPGERRGPFEILSALGVGGRGEVYRARDTRLGRTVAIKVLPSDFAQSPDRLSRFEREARLLAALNDPHVAAIHGVEEVDGQRLLVLECVEGETLAERLAAGPLPVEDALAVAVVVSGRRSPGLYPKGTWMAHVSNESGRNEAYVRPFPGPGARIQVSQDGGAEPVWTRGGREPLYRQQDKFFSVDMGGGANPVPGSSRVLFASELAEGGSTDIPLAYAASADGTEIVGIRDLPQHDFDRETRRRHALDHGTPGRRIPALEPS